MKLRKLRRGFYEALRSFYEAYEASTELTKILRSFYEAYESSTKLTKLLRSLRSSRSFYEAIKAYEASTELSKAKKEFKKIHKIFLNFLSKIGQKRPKMLIFQVCRASRYTGLSFFTIRMC